MGFIGSNLAHRLVELGARVLIVDAMIPDHGGSLFNIQGIEDKVRVNIADVRTETSVRYLVRDQDFIFNLAGQVSHIDSMTDPFNDLEINCRSQLTFLEACRFNNPEAVIVYAGTRQIYGRPAYLPVDEEHLLRPVDVNGVNNVAGEMYHLLYHDCYGLRTTSLRLTNTYGPRMLLKHNRQGFIAWFVRRAIEGACISLYGTGDQHRDLNEVGDVVDAFLRAAATEACVGHAFNLGHTEVVSLREIAQTLMELCPGCSYELVPFPEEKKRIDIGDYYADFSRFRQATGWHPDVRLRGGLERMVCYYRKNRRHYW
jgi:UDP-glucose 4-epimerase